MPFLIVQKDSIHHGCHTEINVFLYLFTVFLLSADICIAVTGLLIRSNYLLENSNFSSYEENVG